MFLVCPATIVMGMWSLTDYASRPGQSGNVVHDWDQVAPVLAGTIQADESTAKLMMFYHPHCPCTQSAVWNLRQLISKSPATVRLHAIAYCPADRADDWIESSLTDSLRMTQNSSVTIDRDGAISKRLGAMTSGHVLLYDTRGKLSFSGGITSRRAHEGGCDSLNDLLDKLRAPSMTFDSWPVYGCPIVVDDAIPDEVTES